MHDVTPQERRRVAEELRRESENAYGLLRTLKGILGIDGTWRHVLSRLADLIDPTCEVVGVVGHAGEWKGEETYTFSLSCGHEVESEWPDPPDYCEECGCRIVRRED